MRFTVIDALGTLLKRPEAASQSRYLPAFVQAIVELKDEPEIDPVIGLWGSFAVNSFFPRTMDFLKNLPYSTIHVEKIQSESPNLWLLDPHGKVIGIKKYLDLPRYLILTRGPKYGHQTLTDVSLVRDLLSPNPETAQRAAQILGQAGIQDTHVIETLFVCAAPTSSNRAAALERARSSSHRARWRTETG